jgi:hypothetical protein
MAEIINFPSEGQPLSYGDHAEQEIPVETVMEAASKEIVKNVIVLGQCEDDSVYFGSSSKDIGKLIVLLEIFKKNLLDAV